MLAPALQRARSQGTRAITAAEPARTPESGGRREYPTTDSNPLRRCDHDMVRAPRTYFARSVAIADESHNQRPAKLTAFAPLLLSTRSPWRPPEFPRLVSPPSQRPPATPPWQPSFDPETGGLNPSMRPEKKPLVPSPSLSRAIALLSLSLSLPLSFSPLLSARLLSLSPSLFSPH